MNVHDLQCAILDADLLPTEKLVALAIAVHHNTRRNYARIYQGTLAADCGLSSRTVRRAVQALREAKIYGVKNTGRSAIFEPAFESTCMLNTGSVDRTPVSYQTGHGCPLSDAEKHVKKRASPWDYDTEFSSRAEEENKRLNEAIAREKGRSFSTL